MNKRILLIATLLFSGFAYAQQTEQETTQTPQGDTPIDGVYKREHVENQVPTPYAPLREADVMWARRVWRQIDLREKINLPLSWPKSRLIDVVMDAVLAGELKAYDPNPRGSLDKGYVDDGDEFRVPMTPEQVAAIGAGRDTLQVQDPITGETRQEVSERTFNRNDVIAYRIKEDWFFDKQRSIFEPRIIGIAPLTLIRNSAGDIIGDGAMTPMFWIYYPEARNIFAMKELFNRFNDGMRVSFDDLFIQRMFSSYIIKVSNAKDERIRDYTSGVDALLEAQRVKDELILFEHDLWEY